MTALASDQYRPVLLGSPRTCVPTTSRALSCGWNLQGASSSPSTSAVPLSSEDEQNKGLATRWACACPRLPCSFALIPASRRYRPWSGGSNPRTLTEPESLDEASPGGENNDDYIELNLTASGGAVCDSKNPAGPILALGTASIARAGPMLTVATATWSSLLRTTKQA